MEEFSFYRKREFSDRRIERGEEQGINRMKTLVIAKESSQIGELKERNSYYNILNCLKNIAKESSQIGELKV